MPACAWLPVGRVGRKRRSFVLSKAKELMALPRLRAVTHFGVQARAMPSQRHSMSDCHASFGRMAV